MASCTREATNVGISAVPWNGWCTSVQTLDLVEAHPHIGTNKLPLIIQRMREAICEAGGQVHLERLIDVEAVGGCWTRCIGRTSQRRTSPTPAHRFILATGHSARDVFELFDAKGWALEAKPFAMGAHRTPQSLVDSIQYHGEERGEVLPPASYRLVCQANGRGFIRFACVPAVSSRRALRNQNRWSPTGGRLRSETTPLPTQEWWCN